MAKTLQQLFLENRGAPVHLGCDEVVQMGKVDIPEEATVCIVFAGNQTYQDNAAVLAIDGPGYILLSNGKRTNAVQIWDDEGLPRIVRHQIASKGKALNVYNKYRTRHSADFVTEDSFTGNAGMVISKLEPSKWRFECSRGPGAFDKSEFVFELSWVPCNIEP